MKNELPKELITGVETIDAQHTELFTRMQNLYDSYLEGKNVQQVIETMHYLKVYINEHLATEEVYMKKINYPNMQRHIVMHRNFINEFSKLEKDLNENGYSSEFNLNFSVKIIDWMKNHVMMEDTLLAKTIKKCELCEQAAAK